MNVVKNVTSVAKNYLLLSRLHLAGNKEQQLSVVRQQTNERIHSLVQFTKKRRDYARYNEPRMLDYYRAVQDFAEYIVLPRCNQAQIERELLFKLLATDQDEYTSLLRDYDETIKVEGVLWWQTKEDKLLRLSNKSKEHTTTQVHTVIQTVRPMINNICAQRVRKSRFVPYWEK